jgi:hypothetical protein
MTSLEMPVEQLEVSARTARILADLGVRTLGDLLAAPSIRAPAQVIDELTFLIDELGLEYPGRLESLPYEIPEDRRVPILHVRYLEGGPPTPTTRMGGPPSAWTDDARWPKCATCHRSMRFVGQIVGPLSLGDLSLHEREAVQIFACLDDTSACESWQPFGGANAALVRKVIGETTVTAPGAALFARFAVETHPAFDDAILAEPSTGASEDEDTFAHGQHDKLGGLPCARSAPRIPSCVRCAVEMRQLAQLASDAVASPFPEGTMFVHLCPSAHSAAVQYVR